MARTPGTIQQASFWLFVCLCLLFVIRVAHPHLPSWLDMAGCRKKTKEGVTVKKIELSRGVLGRDGLRSR